MTSSLGQWTRSFTVLLIYTRIDHIYHHLAICQPAKMVKMAIVTHVAYGQVVINMVDTVAYQNYSEK